MSGFFAGAATFWFMLLLFIIITLIGFVIIFALWRLVNRLAPEALPSAGDVSRFIQRKSTRRH